MATHVVHALSAWFQNWPTMGQQMSPRSWRTGTLIHSATLTRTFSGMERKAHYSFDSTTPMLALYGVPYLMPFGILGRFILSRSRLDDLSFRVRAFSLEHYFTFENLQSFTVNNFCSATALTYYHQFRRSWDYMLSSIRLQIQSYVTSRNWTHVYLSCRERITTADSSFDSETRKTPYHQPSNQAEVCYSCSNIHVF